MGKYLVLIVGLISAGCLIEAGLIQSRIMEFDGDTTTTEGLHNSTTKSPPLTSTTSSPPMANTTSSPPIANTTSRPPVTEGPGIGGGVIVSGDCSFRVTGDLNDPAPLFTPAGILEWIVPTPAGVVEIPNGHYIDMYCSDSFVAPFENMTKITAQCLQGLYFLVDGIIRPFNNFSCTEWPVYTARRTGRKCNGGTDLLEVGFEVNEGFLQTMDICHDEVNEVTRYVHHVLNPSSAAYQRSVARPRFIEGDFYDGKNVDNLYTKIQQNITISNILGMDASPYFNDSIDIYMARGHMAAKVDFIFGAPQMSTFFFVNVAPQWQAFNGGNWERVEDGVRKYVANNNLTTDCYTGIWGVSTLPDVNGIPRELYLAFDENNNGLIPVPKIYFRVVIDRDTRKGIVLIGVNNPHASLEQILEEYVICEDIGHQIDWIQWAKEDLYKGYSYACSVPDFVKVVKDLPLEDLETSGILGIDESEEGCFFRVTGDLTDPAPIFTPEGKFEWLTPLPSGVVELKSGESLDMYCSESFVAAFENQTKITAQCVKGFTYEVSGQQFNFSEFSCSAWPIYTARRTGRKCNGGTDLLEVGFELNGGFLQTMDICHDEVNEVTRYVHHVLNPSSAAYQRSVARPRFIEGDFYDGKNVDNLYTKIQQNITISNILGMDASPYFNDSIDIYMARGHMAAKTDFIFGAPQMSTFFFVNVAPQWQAFNGGNWERVEDGVRKYVANNNLTTDCYTGIWGVSTLPDVNGIPRELYLAFDENNNGLIPVPKIYFRVVIDRDTRKGVVLIGVNNPHASLEQILEEYVICEDIGHQIDWIQWAKDDLYKGYSYACSVPDFIKVVKDLPLEDLETTGILGIDEDIPTASNCSFRVNGDLNDPAPLYTPMGVYQLLMPNTEGTVELQKGESMDMYCTKAFVAPFENYTRIRAQCEGGFQFSVEGQRYNFSQFICSSWPTYTARRTGRSCNGGTDLLEIGFDVDGGFLQTMDVCHDEDQEVTRYVHHVLTPSSGSYQRSVTRPSFKPGDFYAGKNVDNLYTQVQQNNTISQILGMDASPYFEGSNIYLARGHMAAKVDFIFASPQRATFFFVNAAPQWQAFNAGNWERVEDGVRKFVVDRNMTVDCYTGIWGVTTLPDVNGIPRELYLAFDENNNGLIPVPKIYFRVVIDRATKKGIVLVGVNNPHISLQEILEDYVLCEDIGQRIDWINWVKEDLVKGYSYACSVPDFVKVVKHLPLEELETTGLLGIPDVVTESPIISA